MSVVAREIVLGPSVAEADRARDRRYLFGPTIDFLCLGGGWLVIMPVLAMLPADRLQPHVAVFGFWLAHVVNHPHFAHSYQIFYRNLASSAFRQAYGPRLRARYWFAGVVVPVALVAMFLGLTFTGSTELLGGAANIMAFLVGWHYVKQGYGLLIVDSVLKKQFLPDLDKRVLLVNAYAIWLLTWTRLNIIVEEKELLGLQYFTFGIPPQIADVLGFVAAVTTLAVLWALWRRWRRVGALPWNGVVAYASALYAWMLLVRLNPLFVLLVPAFHSLQYLVVVWRYQLNYEAQNGDTAPKPSLPLLRHILGRPVVSFALSGAMLGFAGFYLIPIVLEATVSYDEVLFGPTLFMFFSWIFINIHHYFIDSVIWRRENPDARRYLFS